MLAWIIQITIISFIFIFLVHHLIHFLTNTLTVPKIKDLVNDPSKKYKSIYEIISNSKDLKETTNITNNNISNNSNSNNSNSNNSNSNNSNNSTDIQLLPVISEKDEMKNELKNFLKSQTIINTNTDDMGSASFYQFK
jgi:hypothetical protein